MPTKSCLFKLTNLCNTSSSSNYRNALQIMDIMNMITRTNIITLMITGKRWVINNTWCFFIFITFQPFVFFTSELHNTYTYYSRNALRITAMITNTKTNMMITNVTDMNILPMITVTITKRRNTTMNMLINIMKMRKCLLGRSRHLMLILMQPHLVDLGMLRAPWMLPNR